MTTRTAEAIQLELLVIRAQAGEEPALRELVDNFHEKLLQYAWYQLGSIEAAKDVAQDAWLAIFKGLRTLRDPVLFQPWAQQIVRRRAADWIRNESKRRRTVNQLQSEPVDHLSSMNSDTDATRIEKLKKAIDSLPTELKQVVDLYYGRHYSVTQLASVFGLPEGTIKYRLFRARNKLKQHIKREESNE